jgi:hypothetical protein
MSQAARSQDNSKNTDSGKDERAIFHSELKNSLEPFLNRWKPVNI